MATIPVVNIVDKRVGIVTAIIALLLLYIFMLFITFEVADPPPKDVLVEVAEFHFPPELNFESLKVEGGGSEGAASDHPVDEPKPQTEKIITQKENPKTKEATGESNKTTTAKSSETATTKETSTDPFAKGGASDKKEGPGKDGKFGQSTGPGEEDGKEGSTGGSVKRVLVKMPDIDDLKSNVDVFITLKVTIDPEGNVLYAQIVKGSTTTTDQILINKVINKFKSSAKYNKAPGSGLVTVTEKITIKAR